MSTYAAKRGLLSSLLMGVLLGSLSAVAGWGSALTHQSSGLVFWAYTAAALGAGALTGAGLRILGPQLRPMLWVAYPISLAGYYLALVHSTPWDGVMAPAFVLLARGIGWPDVLPRGDRESS